MYSTFIIFLAILIKCSLQQSQILQYFISIPVPTDNITVTIQDFELLDKNLQPIRDLPLVGSPTTALLGQFHVNATSVDEIYLFKVLVKPQGFNEYITFTRHPGKEDSIEQDYIHFLISIKTQNTTDFNEAGKFKEMKELSLNGNREEKSVKLMCKFKIRSFMCKDVEN
ncbi:unnamed protein product [Caenorhabditis angaria]|uniref:Uncharacterized protein n=1 Tax=Caenorhabditis angaria TaxID=860376 RepID=A0A9P1N0E6_9PELO|nr:unnamed protein product [Caenorhabditis angaria]